MPKEQNKGARKEKSKEQPKAQAKGQPKEAQKPQAKEAHREKEPSKERAKEQAKEQPREPQAPVPARLQEHYRNTLAKELIKRFGYRSAMQVPRISKITLNMGVGEAVADKKIMDNAVGDLTKIAGQKPVVTKSKKSIAVFKIRKDYPVGCKVTLRGARMYEFLDRLVSIAIPRIRDFRGISAKSFDGRGNFNFGIKEQIIFPEIEYDKIDSLRGLNITVTTTAKSDEEARALLAGFKFPFRN